MWLVWSSGSVYLDIITYELIAATLYRSNKEQTQLILAWRQRTFAYCLEKYNNFISPFHIHIQSTFEALLVSPHLTLPDYKEHRAVQSRHCSEARWVAQAIQWEQCLEPPACLKCISLPHCPTHSWLVSDSVQIPMPSLEYQISSNLSLCIISTEITAFLVWSLLQAAIQLEPAQNHRSNSHGSLRIVQ